MRIRRQSRKTRAVSRRFIEKCIVVCILPVLLFWNKSRVQLTANSLVATTLTIGEEDIASWLVEHIIDRPFVYIPNPGNVGDSLILLGTLQLFQRLNLRFKLGSPNKKYKGELLIYAGGGNLVEARATDGKLFSYRNCANFLTDNHHPRSNNTIVLLPHSVRGFETLLEKLGYNVWLWARDQISYNHMSKACTGGAHVRLWHDMALQTSVDIEKLRSYNKKEKANLFAYRTDHESPAGFILPKGNIDITRGGFNMKSQLGGAPELSDAQMTNLTGTNVPKQFKRNVQDALSLLRIVGTRPKVFTNRLHVSIACVIMETDVDVLDNSYGKISSVFNYSLCPSCKYGPKAKHYHLL